MVNRDWPLAVKDAVFTALEAVVGFEEDNFDPCLNRCGCMYCLCRDALEGIEEVEG